MPESWTARRRRLGGRLDWQKEPERIGLARKRGRKWHIAAKRGSIKKIAKGELKDAAKHVEYLKDAVRSKVEHPLRVIRRQFGYRKVHFKGLARNTARILTLFALSNRWVMRRTLLTPAAEVRRCFAPDTAPKGTMWTVTSTPSTELRHNVLTMLADVWTSNEPRLVQTIHIRKESKS